MELLLTKRVRARRRFKALVRHVIANLEWLLEDRMFKGGNILELQRLGSKKKQSILKLKDKALLSKPAEWRTDAEKNALCKVIGGINCFKKYPPDVQLLLAGSLYFTYYGPDRTIVRQSHRPEGMYFIISGEIQAFVKVFDPFSDEWAFKVDEMKTAGHSFGEITLLSDVPRIRTLITKTSVELLFLKRDDFDIILKKSVRTEWDKMTKAIDMLPFFDNWDNITKTYCCLVSRLKVYHKNQTIVSENSGLRSWAHFIVSGECTLIADISVRKDVKSNGKTYYESLTPTAIAYNANLRSKENIKDISLDDLIESTGSQEDFGSKVRLSRVSSLSEMKHCEIHFMQVCTYFQKGVFGLGENMKRRRIIASTDDVECLVIPLYWLTFKGQDTAMWSRIQKYLNSHIPNPQQLHEEFVEQRKWREYKKNLVKTLARGRPCNAATNIPYSIRIMEDYEFIESSK